MTLQNLSNDLNRITSYANIMAQMAKDGSKATLEISQLQAVFTDIANVTGLAYAEMEKIIHNEYVDKYNQ